jgi:hypothetical protein
VPDQNGGRHEFLFHPVCGGHEIRDVRREIRVRKITLALTEPGEVEPQYRDASSRKRIADVPDGFEVLTAAEAVSEQGERLRFAVAGEVESSAEEKPIGIRDTESLEGHVCNLPSMHSLTLVSGRISNDVGDFGCRQREKMGLAIPMKTSERAPSRTMNCAE